MGPLLFLCFINDLPSVLDPKTSVRLFADDCLIYRSIHSQDDRTQLQKDLDSLGSWGDSWGMRFNTKKCNIMHLKNNVSHFYQLNSEFLKEVKDAKYLGLTLTNDMNWSPHITSVASKAHQRLGFLKRNLRGAPYKYRELAYKSLVRPQMEYCCTIWDPTKTTDSDKLERVQRQSARWARGQYGIISVTDLLKDLKWTSLSERRKDQRLALMYQILHSNIAVPPEENYITRTNRPARGALNQTKLNRPIASYKASPLWHSTVFRTIPEWNNLPASVAETDSVTTFRSRLAALRP